MTSRRPMTRSASGNGRTSSFSEEEGGSSNGRTESRNPYLSNVRPENRYSHYRPMRSTLCSVMAQLTEDIQPSFETTLKAKAVSENCNVKFTCVVSGYPAPELTWYKDDMEMDRYCGLPKYEIRRNGKTHSLHIYNCTLDDAAIYQASASNSKGIVSCSGVLEVGTMNEYKIHQRFFAKLKQKAELKKKELEESKKKKGKDNVQQEQPQVISERSQRKRPIPPPKETPILQERGAVQQSGAVALEPNGVSTEVRETAPVTPKDSGVEETETPTTQSPTTETSQTKKIKLSNGLDAGVGSHGNSRGQKMGNGGENSYDGGLSLAQFLADTLHSQAAEEKQNSLEVENSKDMDTSITDVNKEERAREKKCKEWDEKEGEKALGEEHERDREKEQELAIEREKEREKLAELPHKMSHSKHVSATKSHSKAHKDHDHHNIQSSISSVLHTVKDFFFGKSKKDSHEHWEKEEREVDVPGDSIHSSPPEQEPQPLFWLQPEPQPEVDKTPLAKEALPMGIGELKEPSAMMVTEQQSVSLELVTAQKHEREDSASHTEDLPPACEPPPEKVADSIKPEALMTNDVVEPMEVSMEGDSTAPGKSISTARSPVFTEATEKDPWAVPVIQVVSALQQEPNAPVASSEPDHWVTREETKSSSMQDPPGLPLTQASSEETCPPTSIDTDLGSSLATSGSVKSEIDNQGLDKVTADSLEEKVITDDETGKERAFDTHNNHSSKTMWLEQKADLKLESQPFPVKDSTAVNELRTDSLEEEREACDSSTLNQVPVILITDENAIAACSTESDHFKVETEDTPLIQEANVEFPVTVAPESEERADLKILPESTPLVERIEDQRPSEKEHSKSALESNAEGEAFKVFTPFERKPEVSSLDNIEIDEQAFSKVEEIKDRRESLHRDEAQTILIERELEMGKDKEVQVKADGLSKPKSPSKELNKACPDGVSQEVIVATNVEGRERAIVGLTQNAPEIEVFKSTTKDIQDTKPTVPEIRLTEQILGEKIEEMEPEITISTLPRASNKPKSEPTILQRDNTIIMSDAICQAQAVSTVTEDFTPTRKNVLNDDKLPSMEKKQDVVQLDDTTKIFNPEQPFEKTNEQDSQMDHTSVDVVNVSHPDENKCGESVCVSSEPPISDTPQSDESPKVPLFVMPPTPVICDDSPPESNVTTQNEWAKTETLTAILSRATCGLESSSIIEDDKMLRKKPNQEAMSKSIMENTPSILDIALIPAEVNTNVVSIGGTEEVPVTENSKMTPGDTILAGPSYKPMKEARLESDIAVEDLQKDNRSVDRLGLNIQTLPTLSPASLRKFLSRASPGSDTQAAMSVPSITVGDSQSDKTADELSGGSTPTSSLSCESSPRLKRRDSLSLIRSATPEELASGARRKIFLPKTKGEDGEGVGVIAGAPDTKSKKDNPYMSPSQARRAALLQAPTGQHTPPMERRSPLVSRRKATLEVPKVVEETPTEEKANSKPEEKPAEKEKLDPFKAPQVIRKIRGEPFPDASGHLKLWCQFFNVLSDSTIKWYRDEEEILEVKRSGGDESQVALAIVQASSQDCGVYGCTIKNEYGTDTTDFLLSIDILSEILLKDDFEVGEEIEMTPLLFTKGLADSSCWGDKFFGRIMTMEGNFGEGCAHKVSRMKVIYGLDPVFESGSTCIIKVQSPIAYGTKEGSNLVERNQETTKQECKVQNLIREYCKIFAAEARVIDNFGLSLEVNPQYLMYRPANSVPYAAAEADLNGVFLNYCTMDAKGRLITRTISEVEQKCCAFQHWIHQWTHGNLLVTRLEGVGHKLTNVRAVTKSKGYQGLTDYCSPKVFEQFLAQHQCNYYCGLLGLRPLKPMDSLPQPAKMKGSKSPLLNRKTGMGSSSPQLQRRGTNSPQMTRKATSSPKVTRKSKDADNNTKSQETEDNGSDAKPKSTDTLSVIQTR
ncbi:alpha-protein kinase 3 [Lampris incognitus]|uniref:alpha-protein kinase 3 n=1 Tax=Lampris incognitus TaxID=2546036 RepID=UPI0024B491C7|nr:alpha-protein kinase 3 [Lampris incognitus]